MKVIAILAILMLPFRAFGQVTMRLDSIMTQYFFSDQKYVIAISYDSLNHINYSKNVEDKQPTDSIKCLYNKKGILTARKYFVNQGTRFWQGDKIIETAEKWKEVGQDRCDKHGNICFHSNYESGDTLYYQYDDHNRMTSAEWHNQGSAFQKVEYSYDRNGNTIRVDVFSLDGRGKQQRLKHQSTLNISYDLNHKAENTAGVNEGIVTEIRFNDAYQWAIREFIRKEIQYMPTFINIPVSIVGSHHDDPEEDIKVYYYYSMIK